MLTNALNSMKDDLHKLGRANLIFLAAKLTTDVLVINPTTRQYLVVAVRAVMQTVGA